MAKLRLFQTLQLFSGHSIERAQICKSATCRRFTVERVKEYGVKMGSEKNEAKIAETFPPSFVSFSGPLVLACKRTGGVQWQRIEDDGLRKRNCARRMEIQSNILIALFPNLTSSSLPLVTPAWWPFNRKMLIDRIGGVDKRTCLCLLRFLKISSGSGKLRDIS